MIKIKGLSKSFRGVQAVRDLTLDIAPGEIFGYLGPNGAGKTTTVMMLTGILQPTSGEAYIDGMNIAQEPLKVKKILGLVPDQPFIYPKLTGQEFMRFIGDMYEVSWERQKQKIPQLLKMFELSEWSNQLIESYSHGMRQKLVLAGVLLHQPKVLFLDEPMVGLDPKSAKLVKEIFSRLAASGVTIFMSTHVLEIAEKLCHRIAIVQEGRVTSMGTTEELRQMSAKGGSLEDVYLSLTGGEAYGEMIKYLS